MKRKLVIFLTSVMLLSSFQVTAWADEPGTAADGAEIIETETETETEPESEIASTDDAEQPEETLGASEETTEETTNEDPEPVVTEPSEEVTEVVAHGWKQNSRGSWYEREDGSYPSNKWEKIGGTWYHFDALGYVQTGWKKIDNRWYYFREDGSMVSNGIYTINGNSFFFYSGGNMAEKSWIKPNTLENYYMYADRDGILNRGEWKENQTGRWYEYHDGTYAVDRWVLIPDTTQDGEQKVYYFNERGYSARGWKQVSGQWYYFDTDCSLVPYMGITELDAHTYYFKEDHSIYTNSWIDETYYANESGFLVTGKI